MVFGSGYRAMIKRIHIVGYKSLADVTIDLKPLTVLMGLNAAGKSNLFDALGLLARVVNCRTLREAFEQHRGTPIEAFHLGDGGPANPAPGGSARLTMEVEVELSAEAIAAVELRIRRLRGDTSGGASGGKSRGPVRERLLRYSLSLEIAPVTGLLRVADERLVALNQDGSESRRRLPFIERVKGKLRLRLDGQAHPTDSDIGLDYSLISQPLYPPHYPHIAAFKEELSRWHFYSLEPKAMRAEAPPEEVFNLQRDGAGLAAFFHTLGTRDGRKLADFNRSLSLSAPEVEEIKLETTGNGRLQLILVEHGACFSAPLISEGTLRILGLLAITHPSACSTLVGCEEPENGFPPGRYKLIADLLRGAADRGAQLLVATHSPLLAGYFDDDALLICRCSERRTQFSHFRSSGPLMRLRELKTALED